MQRTNPRHSGPHAARAQVATDKASVRITRTVQNVLIDRLIDLVDDARAPAEVRAIAEEHMSRLGQLAGNRAAQVGSDLAELAHLQGIARRVQAFVQRQDREPRRAPKLETPPGSPIGSSPVGSGR